MSCKHCYISYSGNRNPMELLKLVKKLKEKYEVVLNGAEVLTNIEYLNSYKELGQKYILTNGYELYKNIKIIDVLKKYNITSVSISYHFGIHDKISLILSTSLKKVFKELKNNNLNYRIMTTITSKNYNDIEKMCEEAIKLGADGIYFTNYIQQGNAIKMDDSLKLSQEQITSFFKQLIKVRKKYTKDELLIERDGGFGPNELLEKDHFVCPSVNNLVVLTPDNNLYPCIFLAKPGYEIGKLVDGKLYIFEEYNNINTGTKCFAKEICNNNKCLIKKYNN